MRLFFLLLFLAFNGVAATAAIEPGERLADPALEARARAIGRQLRCPVCQNTSIDESDATLAHDLRVLVRERVVAGDSNEQVLQFMRQRYGDFILLTPPFTPVTWALWLAPAAGLAVVAGFGVMRWRQAGRIDPVPLSDEQRAAAAKLMADEGTGLAS